MIKIAAVKLLPLEVVAAMEVLHLRKVKGHSNKCKLRVIRRVGKIPMEANQIKY